MNKRIFFGVTGLLVGCFIGFLAGSQGVGYLSAFVAGIFGLVVLVVFLLWPEISFYGCIVYGFLFFDVQRLIDVELPFGLILDLMLFTCFFGVLIRKKSIGQSFWVNMKSPILLGYFVILIYSILEFFNPLAAPFGYTFGLFRRFLALLIFLYCALFFLNNIRQSVRFVKILLGFCLAAALYACFQEWFGYPKYQMNYILSDPVRERLMSLDNGNYRKFSTFSSPTDFGIMMSGAALVAVTFLVYGSRKWIDRVCLFFILLFTLLAMSYSGTRTATFMFVAGVVTLMLMNIRRKSTLIYGMLFAALFGFLIFGPIYGNSTINRLRTTFEFSSEKSMEVRDVNRERIQPFIYSHPLGGGLGTSGGNAVPGHPLSFFPPDSGLLRTAVEYGWIGLTLQCILYWVILQQGAKAYYFSRNSQQRLLLLASTVTIFGFIVAQYAQVAVGMVPGSFMYFGLMAIIVMSNARRIENV